jgi:hypothetical protein
MAVHIGKKIKEEVYRQGLGVSEFARKINRSRNVVYNIFERESVDTALLHKIGRILHCDFFSLFSAQKEYNQEGMRSFQARDPEPGYGGKSEDIVALQRQNSALKNEVAYLKKIVVLLEKETRKQTKKK